MPEPSSSDGSSLGDSWSRASGAAGAPGVSKSPSDPASRPGSAERRAGAFPGPLPPGREGDSGLGDPRRQDGRERKRGRVLGLVPPVVPGGRRFALNAQSRLTISASVPGLKIAHRISWTSIISVLSIWARCLSNRSASSASSSSRVRCSWANRADCQPGGKPCDVGPRSESPSVRSARLERVASYRILCPPAASRAAQGRLPGTGPSGPPRRLQTISAYHGPVMVAGS